MPQQGTSLEAMSVLIDAAATRLCAGRGGKAPVAAIEQALAAQRSRILLHGEWLAPVLQFRARGGATGTGGAAPGSAP
ncbi:hypothetical protein [Halochromatium roseum]|uniref:hypothetical protein n=1 Tax=Halochromatium roseum TaxID=391920 RepID=UPI0019120656|nr:hypothetical protein [Halochromatium roseum]MBK5938167.1 hypothetical protein [Halochromatium roseum]